MRAREIQLWGGPLDGAVVAVDPTFYDYRIASPGPEPRLYEQLVPELRPIPLQIGVYHRPLCPDDEPYWRWGGWKELR